MKPLYEIEEYKGEKFILLSEKETEDYNKKYGTSKGYIGDCYLISSIRSMTNIPLIFNYIFKNPSKINERTEYIEILVYENEMKKNISFKNTYATYKNHLLFARPFNKELYAIALEKAYATLNCTDNTI